MGNSSSKKDSSDPCHVIRQQDNYLSQQNLANVANNLSQRSIVSGASQQSSYSLSRPWSRISRRRWKQSTLNEPLKGSKTAWPVTRFEEVFLPEFQFNVQLTESSFRVIELISHGTYGQVHKVQKLDDNRIYALKIISKSQIISENAVTQVKEEVAIQNICGHNPFIVSCHQCWQSHRKLFILSDYVEGGELYDFCNKYGKLPERLVKFYVAEIALALDFLHNAGVIYRDLKPENILLDKDGHIQLIDFGLSKWLKYGAKTTTLCGTFRYMAPEIAAHKLYGHAADWWSLGVLACIMLSGKYPVPAIPITETIEFNCDDVSGDPGTLPEYEFSSAARTLLQRLLEIEPDLRLKSVHRLQQTAFFKDFNFAHARSLKYKPREILLDFFPNGPPVKKTTLHVEGFEFTADGYENQ